MTAYRLTVETPLGPVTVTEQNDAIAAIAFAGASEQTPTALLDRARRQIEAYFDGDRTPFDLPLAPAHSEFQRRIRAAMIAIPFGETRSYGALAKALGSAARAVGQACGSNPIPLVVPCHRVLAANGGLGGFSAGDGPVTKRRLLDHEAPPATQRDLFA